VDTSKEYIDMCRKAVEIQITKSGGLRPTPDHGDYLFIDGKVLVYLEENVETAVQHSHEPNLHIMESWNDEYSHRREINDLVIWLPRQDQLQEMVSNEFFKANIWYSETHLPKPLLMIDWMLRQANDLSEYMSCSELFVGGFSWSAKEYYLQFTTMEQFWLAAVMNNKFNKRWTGEDWEMIKQCSEQQTA
jgi:hypothetical protein